MYINIIIKYLFKEYFYLQLTMETPKKLAFYYNWLTSAHPDRTVESAVKELAKYDMVCIAGSLAFPSHGNHNAAKQALNHAGLKNTEVYGYVNTSDNVYDLIDHVQAWKNMGGAVVGVFCDRFGFDYPLFNLEDTEQKDSSGHVIKINRAHQNFLVREIHLAGLKVFVNAWVQEHVFAPEPTTGRLHNLNPDDWSLLESYQINSGEYVPEKTWRQKIAVVNKYRGQANFACTTTTANNYENQGGSLEQVFDEKKFNYAYVSSIVDRLQAFSYGLDMFGATLPLAPFRPRLEPTKSSESDGTISFTEGNGIYKLGGSSFVGASVNTITKEVLYFN